MIDYAKKFEADTGSYPFTTRKAVALPGHATIEYVDWLGRQLTAKDMEAYRRELDLRDALASGGAALLRDYRSLVGRKNTEIAELKDENELTTKERDNHFRDIIKLENELSELKVENKRLASSNLKLDMENQSLGRSLTAKDKEIDELKETILNLGSEVDNGDSMYSILKKAHEALKAKISKGIQVDIAYTGSTNIITNLPNALYGKFILIGLTEMENDDD